MRLALCVLFLASCGLSEDTPGADLDQLLANRTACDDGSFVVVWNTGSDEEGHTVRAQRLSVYGQLIARSVDVSAIPSSVTPQPDVAALAGGGFTVMWRHDGTEAAPGRVLLTRSFDAEGRP